MKLGTVDDSMDLARLDSHIRIDHYTQLGKN